MGSIPFGIIVAKLTGLGDLTKQGSGNIGATNVVRVGGRKLGAVTFLLDFLKGCLPTILYINIFGTGPGEFICALLTVIGHIFSVFNKFKGGKGVATGFGVIMAADPTICIISLLLWLGCFLVTRISSASALFSFAMTPFIVFILSDDKNLIAFSILLSLIIYITHYENIKRLLNGREGEVKADGK